MTRTAIKLGKLVGVALAGVAALAAADRAQAQGAAPADLSGTYQCQPDPSPCTWPGNSPSITQDGKQLVIKSANGDMANATLTSDSTISAGGTFNSSGIIRQDHSIEWSDGTKWRKH